MPNFILKSHVNPRFDLRLADCSTAHAQSVVDQLTLDPSTPDDVYATEVTDLYPELSSVAPPAKRRPWYRRIF